VAESPDQITLSGLRVHGHHGVYASERAAGQDFIIDVALRLDTRTAASTDNVAETVHYGELADALVAEVADGPRVNLLETLAERLAQVCLRNKLVDSCEVTVHKPQAPIAHHFADVSVTIERSR
jgi:dihydroneopterin aldolase